MNNNKQKTLAIFTLIGVLAVVTTINVRPLSAWDPDGTGASPLSSGHEFQNDPKYDNAKSFAPGQLVNGPVPCSECAKAFTPGQEALTAGIIGPSISK